MERLIAVTDEAALLPLRRGVELRRARGAGGRGGPPAAPAPCCSCRHAASQPAWDECIRFKAGGKRYCAKYQRGVRLDCRETAREMSKEGVRRTSFRSTSTSTEYCSRVLWWREEGMRRSKGVNPRGSCANSCIRWGAEERGARASTSFSSCCTASSTARSSTLEETAEVSPAALPAAPGCGATSGPAGCVGASTCAAPCGGFDGPSVELVISLYRTRLRPCGSSVKRAESGRRQRLFWHSSEAASSQKHRRHPSRNHRHRRFVAHGRGARGACRFSASAGSSFSHFLRPWNSPARRRPI